ncbi:MAG: sugar phosphate isomerase/epimerase [Cyclobacteriaceae bacterium]
MDRRKFVKQTALAATSLAFLPSCTNMSSSKLSDKVGVQLYTVRDLMKEDPIGTLEKISKIGYTQIEAASFVDGKSYGFTGKELKKIVGDLGLDLVSGHVSTNVFEESFDTALDFVADAGQEYIVMPYLQAEQRMTIDQYKGHAETLNRCGEKAKKANVSVCYHNHDFEFQTLEGQIPMDVLMSETDPEFVKMELDLYWVVKAGFDPIQYFDKHEGRIPLWHVKDMANTEERGFADVGSGTIDFKEIFDKLDVSGMKHFFVERDRSDDPMKTLENSFKNLSTKILS